MYANLSYPFQVTLQIEDESSDGPKTIQKRVQIINNCTCLSCDKTSNSDCELSDERTAELPIDLFSTKEPTFQEFPPPEEVPELLKFLPNKTRNNTNLSFDVMNITTKEQKYELNAKLIALLRSIQEQDDDSTNFNYDKAQLRELLNIIEGSEHQLSDKNLMEFVNFVNVHNSEDLELDLSRLKEVLTNFQKTQELQEKHRNFGLGLTEGLEGSHLNMGHKKGAHIAMGIHNKLDEFPKKHYIGEEQKLVSHIGMGHLIRGPHGSLVVEADHPKGVEEKLNVESHLLKPNHEGTIINYENHNYHKKVIEN